MFVVIGGVGGGGFGLRINCSRNLSCSAATICVIATCSPRARRLRNVVKIAFVCPSTVSIGKDGRKFLMNRNKRTRTHDFQEQMNENPVYY